MLYPESGTSVQRILLPGGLDRLLASVAAALVALFMTGPAAFAQTPQLVLTTVSYDVGGFISANDTGQQISWGGRDVRINTTSILDAVTLDEEFEAEASNAVQGSARAEVSVYASATAGHLHVGLTSGALTVNTNPVTGNPNDLHVASARMNTGKVQARWQDTVIPDAPGIYRRTIFLGLLEVTGSMALNLTKPEIPADTYVFAGGSGGDLTLRLFSSNDLIKPYPAGYVGRIKADTISGSIVNDLPTNYIPVQMIMRDGEPFTIDYMLELLCTAGADLGTNARVPLSTAAYFDANFTQSIRWGGIISATDFDTGLPVTDYSLVSGSGFDYRYAAPVPEPASLATLSLATIALIAKRRRA